MTFVLILLGVRDATASAGELNVSSLYTEEHVRTRSLAPSFLHSKVSMRRLSRENVGEDFRIRTLMRCEAGKWRDVIS